jgi:hypothetical protein
MIAQGRKPRGWSRLAWFIVLYIGSLAVFAAVVCGLRAFVPR